MLNLDSAICGGRDLDAVTIVQELTDKERGAVFAWLKSWWPTAPVHKHPLRDLRKQAGHCAALVAIVCAPDAPKAVAVRVPELSFDSASLGRRARAVAARGKDFAEAFVARITREPSDRQRCLGEAAPLLDAFDLPAPAGLLFHVASLFGGLAYQRTQANPLVLDGLLGIPGEAGAEPRFVWLDSEDPVEHVRNTFRPQWMFRELCAIKDGFKSLLSSSRLSESVNGLSTTVKELIGNGRLDPVQLADDLLGALMRGDSPKSQRLQAQLLVECAPGLDWLARHTDALVNLLGSADTTAAGQVQALLRQLDRKRPLADERFLTSASMVFARRERGAREQLVAWAAERANTQERAALACRSLAAALLLDDHPLHSLVVRQVVMLWPSLAIDARPAAGAALIAAAATIDAPLRRQLESLTGVEPAIEPAGSIVAHPEPPLAESARTPFMPLTADLASLHEAKAKLEATGTVSAYEQWFDVRVRLDGQGRPLASWSAAEQRTMCDQARHDYRRPESEVLKLREMELALSVKRKGGYANLARPVWEDGSIDADVLVDRLRALAQAGAQAASADLLLALMRTSIATADDIAALREIGSDAARIAADFFTAGGMSQLTTRLEVVAAGSYDRSIYSHSRTRWHQTSMPELSVSLAAMALPPEIEGVPLRWAEGFTTDHAPDLNIVETGAIHTLALMPKNGEVLAASHLWGLRLGVGIDGIDSWGAKDVARALPHIIAAGGPAGPALHLALLYSLSAADAGSRLQAVDALLAFVGQGRLDALLMADLTRRLVTSGTIKATRLAGTLAQVADAGAGAKVFTIVHAALDAALRLETPPPGSPDLAALLVRLLPQVAEPAPIAVLAEVAARKGNTKLLLECRRLHTAYQGALL